MNILDENIIDSQRLILKNWKVHIRQIGHEIGNKGMTDAVIIPLLHRIGGVTFYTRDVGFFKKELCHSKYCLVCLAIGQSEVASFIRRILKHPEFNSQEKRMGKVILVSHLKIRLLELKARVEIIVDWST